MEWFRHDSLRQAGPTRFDAQNGVDCQVPIRDPSPTKTPPPPPLPEDAPFPPGEQPGHPRRDPPFQPPRPDIPPAAFLYCS